MKLTREQKMMIGFPLIIACALAGLIIPICLADQGKSPWWLLLWVPTALMGGVLCVFLSKWADDDQ